jgi:hypothetical protein
VIVEPPVIVAPQEIIQEEPGPIIPAQEADAVQSEVECDPALVETYYYETDDCYSGEYSNTMVPAPRMDIRQKSGAAGSRATEPSGNDRGPVRQTGPVEIRNAFVKAA